MKHYRLTIVLTLAIVSISCESPFDPKGPFLDRAVVYGVLTPKNTAHIVRLYTTYNPPAFDPLENMKENQLMATQVLLTFNTTTYTLRDTMIARDDPTRYADSVHAYVAAPVVVAKGGTYVLSTTVPSYGILTGTTTVPASGTLEIDQDSRFSLTTPSQGNADITIIAVLQPGTIGHAVRVFVEYELPAVNPGVILTEEIPMNTVDYKNCTTFGAQYPRVRRRELVGNREFWKFPLQHYRRALLKIVVSHQSTLVQFRRVYVELLQTDEHLYKYYSIVNGFQDEFSIRVDQPNYSNIEGGLGVFGSFISDTTVISASLGATFPVLLCND